MPRPQSTEEIECVRKRKYIGRLTLEGRSVHLIWEVTAAGFSLPLDIGGVPACTSWHHTGVKI